MNKIPIKSLAKRLTIIFVLFVLSLPVIWVFWFMIVGSLLPYDELLVTIGPALGNEPGMAKWPLLPSWPTLAPLVELLFETPQFFVMFWNSMKISIPIVGFQILIGAPAAWALSRLRYKGRKFLQIIFITMMLMPFQVTMVPNYLVANTLGLMDTIWSVVLPSAFSAFPVFIMMKSFEAIPRSIIEAAAIDGANQFLILIRIGLPLGMPGILSAAVLGFLESWNMIEQPLIFLKSKENWPLSLFLPQIMAERLSLAMVSSSIMIIPAILVFTFGQKYLELGIQTSGVKE